MEMCRRTLGMAADPGAAPYQVSLTVCDHCGRTWQDAGGESVELTPRWGSGRLATRSMWGEWASRSRSDLCPPGVGESTRADTHVGVHRATRTIPPATRRQVHHRDKGHFRVPGRRNHTWLDLHHLRPQAEGGSHDPAGLLRLCGAYRALLHRELLIIEATTEQDARVAHAGGTLYGAPPRPIEAQAGAAAFAALRSLGFGETESRHALTAARTNVGVDATNAELITAALKVHQQQPRRAA